MSQTLDCTLERLSIDIWERLRTLKFLPPARSVRFGEETITDILMLDLNRSPFRRAIFTQTPKHREAQRGTDFECWLGSDSLGWIRLAIQAKKLDVKSDRYNSLNHKVNASKGTKKSQIEILENYATSNGAVPLYCLYNYSDDVDPCRHWHCCQRPFRVEEMGCTLTPSSVIKRSIKQWGKRNFDFIHEFQGTLPWRCLASCPNIGEAFALTDETDSPGFPSESSRFFETRPRRYAELPPSLRERVRDTVAGSEWAVLRADEFDPDYYSLDAGLPKRVCILERDQ